MQIPSKIVLSLLLWVTCVFSAGGQSAGDIHSFTGPNGTTLEAEILDFADRKVIIRRLSDGQNFVLPADRLAPADVDFMRAWLAARETSKHPLGWKRLRVHLPEFADEVEAPGIPEAFRRIDLHTWEAELPEGAWVAVKLLRQPGSDFTPQFLLPFTGEREWFLSYADARLFRATDPKGEKTLAGIAILADDDERELRAMKKDLPDSGVAIYSGFIDEADLAILGSSIFSAVVKKMSSFSVAKGGKLRALRVTEAMNEFDGLAGYDELEFLEAPHSGDFPLAACAKLKGLTTLLADGDLQLDTASGDGSFPALRHLSFRGTEIDDPESFPTFIAQLKILHSLSLPDEATLHLGDLAKCLDLTAVDFGDDCGDPGAGGIGALKNLTTVLLNGNYTPADLAVLLENGVLAKVRTLRTNHPLEFEKLPLLRTLSLQGNRDGVDFSNLATPPTLTHLKVLGATDGDIFTLGKAGPRISVQSLSLRLLNISSLEPLKTLPKLVFLNLEDQYVTSDQKLAALDLSPFPALRGLQMVQLQNLTELSVSADSKLEALSARACGELLEIKSPTIATLREIAIANCGVLNSIGGMADGGDGVTRRVTGSPRLQ